MRMKKINFRDIWKNYGILVIFLILFIVLSISSDAFFSVENLTNILKQTSILGIVSLGVFATLIAGNVDLSVGSILGLSAAICAKVALNGGVFLAFISVLAVSILIGFINGYFSTRGKGLSIMVTLSMKFIIYSGTLLITQTRPISNLPEALVFLGKANIGFLPMPILLLIIFIIVFWIFFSYTISGRRLYAVGSNDLAAKFSGVSVKKLQIITFVISAFCAAVAGLILMGRVASAQPNAGVGMELDAIGAVLIGGASLQGGRGNVRGTIIGVLIFGLINNGLNLLGVDPLFRDAVKGGIILIAILIDQWGRD
jgi:ribose/xylose/arabinose/galactoside ABC-type transport system permease subunit